MELKNYFNHESGESKKFEVSEKAMQSLRHEAMSVNSAEGSDDTMSKAVPDEVPTAEALKAVENIADLEREAKLLEEDEVQGLVQTALKSWPLQRLDMIGGNPIVYVSADVKEDPKFFQKCYEIKATLEICGYTFEVKVI